MPALVQQLSSLEAAGSYSLQCSVDELRNASSEAGFGVNWDALADTLCDLSWCDDAAGYVLLLRNVSDTFGLSANDREIVQDILTDTAVYWRQHKKPFWVFSA